MDPRPLDAQAAGTHRLSAIPSLDRKDSINRSRGRTDITCLLPQCAAIILFFFSSSSRCFWICACSLRASLPSWPVIGLNPFLNTGLSLTFCQSCNICPFSTEHLTSSRPRGTISSSYAEMACAKVDSLARTPLRALRRWETSQMQWLRP